MSISDRTLKLAARGDLRAVRSLLSQDPGLLDAASGGHDRTLLWEAANAGRSGVVKFLVEAGADVNARMGTGQTPLALALKQKRPAAAALLRTQGGTV